MALSGCSSDADQPAADDGLCAAQASTEREGLRPIEVPTAEVTLLNPGTGDLAPLTPAPSKDRAQNVTLTTDSLESSIVPGDGGQQQVQRTQQNLTTPLRARVVCDDPSNVEFTIGLPTTSDTALTPELGALTDSPGGITFAAGLNPSSLRLFPNEDSQSPARSALEQSFTGALNRSVPLPAEPVGTGASWRAVRTVRGALTVTQTTTVTLEKRTGTVLNLRVQVEEAPADSVFRIPGSAQTLHVARFSNTGSGTVTVDLTQALPVEGRIVTKGARELVGDDPSAPLLQQNEFTLAWKRG